MTSAPGSDYETWFSSVVHQTVPAPNTWPACSWALGTVWGTRAFNAMKSIERDCAAHLIEQLEVENVRGPIVEFGVFEGYWLRSLIDICESRDLDRNYFGYDSFEGLPRVSDQDDLDCFQQGQFAADYQSVARYLELQKRANVKLLQGWFSDTLKLAESQSLSGISFARIDCDLYAPAVECLNFLGSRLADKSILVFDDWTFNLEKGETRAFAEWVPRVPHLGFEFLFFSGAGQLYLRCLERKYM